MRARSGRSSRLRSRPSSVEADRRRSIRWSKIRRTIAAGTRVARRRACSPRYTRSNMNAPQREHRLADLGALADVARRGRGLDEVVDERVDPLRARWRRAARSPAAGSSVGREDARADGVVDVVVDVGDPVDDADDPALERVRLRRAGVVEDPVAHLLGQVQPAAVALEHVDDTQRVLVVAEAAARTAPASACVERLLPGVAERRVPEIVAEPDRLDEVLVQPQRARDDARDSGRLERVRQARAVVVAVGVRRRPGSCASGAGTPWSARSGRGRAGTACAAGTAPPRARARASRTSARRAARATCSSSSRMRASKASATAPASSGIGPC